MQGLPDLSFFSDLRVLYLAVVLGISGFLLLRGLFIIKSEKKRRLNTIEDMEFTDAVDLPVTHNQDGEEDHFIDDGEQLIHKRRAVQSLESRFQFMRRFYIPTVLFVTLILVLLPFLPTLPATYLSLLTGVLAGIVGLAARPVIENAIGGIVLTFSQPIRINDTVIIDGEYGTIERINLLHTVVKIWNWRRLVIPNHRLLEKEILNLTLSDESEWAYISFYVEPTSDIQMVKDLAKKSMIGRYLDDSEEPSFWVMDMEKDSILCWVAGWAKDPARAWALKAAARRELIISLQKHNIKFQMANTNIHVGERERNQLSQI